MNSTIPIGKAKAEPCDLVEQAGKGRDHVITVHGQPAAQLGAVRARAGELTQTWRKRREQIVLNPEGRKRLEIPELIRAGRK